MVITAELYWSGTESSSYHTEVNIPWSEKMDKYLWRGMNSVGRHDERNWRHFHRQRFLSLPNATYLRVLVDSDGDDWAGALFGAKLVALSRGWNHRCTERIADFLDRLCDTGFSIFLCPDDMYNDPTGPCPQLEQHFKLASFVSLDEMLKIKYIYDIDVTSFSGEYRFIMIKDSRWRRTKS